MQQMRKAGMIPGIIYGHGKSVVTITLNHHDVQVAILHGERLIEMDVDGETENVLFKEVQYDTFGKSILHVDMTRVNLDERVEVTIPVLLRGTPAGATEQGVLRQDNSEVAIECVVTAIPDEIRASVTEMQVGVTLTAADLLLPDGATLISDPTMHICTVTLVAEEVEVEEEEGEESAQPEVIGEKPAEDQDEASE